MTERTAYDQAYYDAAAAGDVEFNYADYPLNRMEIAPPAGWLLKHGWGDSPLKDEFGTPVGQGPDGYIFPMILTPYLLQDPMAWQKRGAIEQVSSAYVIPRYGKLFIWALEDLPPEGYLDENWVSYTTMTLPGKPGKTYTNPKFAQPVATDEPD
jgi:hypothetical protein